MGEINGRKPKKGRETFPFERKRANIKTELPQKEEIEAMQMVEVNSKNVDSITREGKTYLYFTAGFSPFAAAIPPVCLALPALLESVQDLITSTG